MISFVIPTLNEEKYIGKTLEIISGYKGAYEIIVSDGGSHDRTVEIARNYTDKVIVHTKSYRQTIPEGRNVGAFSARGTYVVELDADTHFPDINDFFETMIDAFESNRNIVAATTWFRVYPNDETQMDWLIYGITGLCSLIICNYMGGGSTSGGEFQMMRRDAFMQVGGYDESLIVMEDNDLFARMHRIGSIYFEPGLKIHHSGRRAHKLGWSVMISDFVRNAVSIAITKKPAMKVWEEIR